MQIHELINSVKNNLDRVNTILVVDFMELSKQDVIEAQESLQRANCAMLEIKHRMLGSQPPKIGN